MEGGKKKEKLNKRDSRTPTRENVNEWAHNVYYTAGKQNSHSKKKDLLAWISNEPSFT